MYLELYRKMFGKPKESPRALPINRAYLEEEYARIRAKKSRLSAVQRRKVCEAWEDLSRPSTGMATVLPDDQDTTGICDG